MNRATRRRRSGTNKRGEGSTNNGRPNLGTSISANLSEHWQKVVGYIPPGSLVLETSDDASEVDEESNSEPAEE